MKNLNTEFVLKLILANYGGRPISIDRLLYILFILDSKYYERYKVSLLNIKWDITSELDSEQFYEKVDGLKEFRIMTSYDVNEKSYEVLHYIGEGEKMVFSEPVLKFVNNMIRENIFLRMYELESKVKDSESFMERQFQSFVFGSHENVNSSE